MNIYESGEWKALLATICEYPDDDRPRLVAADWLQEQGAAVHAEFIQLQIAIDRLGIRLGYNRCHEILEDGTDVDTLLDRENWLWRVLIGSYCRRDAPLVKNSYYEPFTKFANLVNRRMFVGLTPARRRVWFVIERGFVGEVQADEEVLRTRYCRSCDGVGDDAGRLEVTTICPVCKGDGAGPSDLQLFLAEHPITRVVATDVEIWQPGQNSGNWFISTQDIPRDLFDRIDLPQVNTEGRVLQKWAVTRKRVEQAISDALLEEARARMQKV